eukprot:CAMPEP_0197449108 /NCGR_PEP_ID=MMETSP1175-20131217/20139_1 /TAXON_ID=1003142 /ORGANISM="Triceratium dubium, Strain CCMP147" /LENGTH=1253 /DNA_ID=CAMNT_0042981119 /DNA_START=687 /DNA_END=4448 /DNA_ORIENTATION=+
MESMATPTICPSEVPSIRPSEALSPKPTSSFSGIPSFPFPSSAPEPAVSSLPSNVPSNTFSSFPSSIPTPTEIITSSINVLPPDGGEEPDPRFSKVELSDLKTFVLSHRIVAALPNGKSFTFIKSMAGDLNDGASWLGMSGFSVMHVVVHETSSGESIIVVSIIDTDDGMGYLIRRNIENEYILTGMHSSEMEEGNDTGISVPANEDRDSFQDWTPSGTKQRYLEEEDIGVMILWTKAAECEVSLLERGCALTPKTAANMEALIEKLIKETNSAFLTSGAGAKIRLVHQFRDPLYSEASDSSTVVKELMTSDDGMLDYVHAKRSLYGADVVAMIVMKEDDLCGQAADIGPLKEAAFFIASWSCASHGLTFTHELGHIMGCQHDRGTLNECGDETNFSFGFRDPKAKFRSIMAYNCKSGQCDKNVGGGCQRVPMFSTPDEQYKGKAIGDSNTDNARQIQNAWKTMAAWYPVLENPRFFEIYFLTGTSEFLTAKSDMTVEIEIRSVGYGDFEPSWTYSFDLDSGCTNDECHFFSPQLAGYFEGGIGEFILSAGSKNGWFIKKMFANFEPNGVLQEIDLKNPSTGEAGIWLDKEPFNSDYGSYEYDWRFYITPEGHRPHKDQDKVFPTHSPTSAPTSSPWFAISFVTGNEENAETNMAPMLTLIPILGGPSHHVVIEGSECRKGRSQQCALHFKLPSNFDSGIKEVVLRSPEGNKNGWLIDDVQFVFTPSQTGPRFVDLTNPKTLEWGIWLDGEPFGSAPGYGKYDFDSSFVLSSHGYCCGGTNKLCDTRTCKPPTESPTPSPTKRPHEVVSSPLPTIRPSPAPTTPSPTMSIPMTDSPSSQPSLQPSSSERPSDCTHMHLLTNLELMSWEQHEEVAKELSGHIAPVYTELDHDCIKNWLRLSGLNVDDGAEVWLGATDKDESFSWKWVDNGEIFWVGEERGTVQVRPNGQLYFTDWLPGQPDSANGVQIEHYLGFFRGKWNNFLDQSLPAIYRLHTICDVPFKFNWHSSDQENTYPMWVRSFSSNPRLKQSESFYTTDTCFIRLTPDNVGELATSAFIPFTFEPLNIDHNFSLSVAYRIYGDTSGAADGIAFVMHQDPRGTSALGGVGKGMGVYKAYHREAIKPSFVIELDTYFNEDLSDQGRNHIHAMTIDSSGNTVELGEADNVAIRTAEDGSASGHLWIENCGEKKVSVFVNNTGHTKPSLPQLEIPFDFGAFFKNTFTKGNDVYVGFTSSTYYEADNHDIMSWSFGQSCSL